MDRVNIVLIATLLVCGALVGCGSDATDETGDDTTPTTPDLPIPSHECGFDKECEGKFSDLTPCEDAVCDAGTCAKQARGTWASCDHPDAGTCEGGYCNEGSQCVVRTADDGTPCDQDTWSACAIAECASGVCNPVDISSCDDNNPCTDDSCDATTGDCINAANTATCDDGNPCTGDDVCADGACSGTELNELTGNNDLCKCTTDDECAIYDNGDWCDGVWECGENGVCAEKADSAVTCEAGTGNGGCLSNACNPNTGACELTAVDDYEHCSDGDACTGCAAGIDDCGSDGDYCQNGECIPGNGSPCEGCDTADDCVAFDDDNKCNGVWSCQKFVGQATGVCEPLPGSAVTCPTSDCFDSVCEPTTGECVNTEVICDAPPGPACDGLSVVTYPALGVCTDGDSPPCAYEPIVEDCDVAMPSVCAAATTLEGEACDADTPCASDDETCAIADGETAGVCAQDVPAQSSSFTPVCNASACDHLETVTICEDPMASMCSGDDGLTLTTYTSLGTCNVDSDACDYTETTEDCNVAMDDVCTTTLEGEACDTDTPCASDDETCSDAGVCVQDVPAEVWSYMPICTDSGCDYDTTVTTCAQDAMCTGTVLTTYAATCAADDSDTCEFAGSDTDCADTDELCHEGACAAAECTCATDDCDGADDTACATDTDVCVDSFCCSPMADCGDITCGSLDDGCGGTLACGDCTGDDVCTDGACGAPCTADCSTATCGDDGCGGSCGDCTGDDVCTDGACGAPCTADCSTATCGDDGCGGSCGDCTGDDVCTDGACGAPCTADCSTATCGDDGCGGSCGDCTGDDICTAGACNADACAATPCLNSGVCTDGGDGTSYTCDCTGTGFTGDDCEDAEITATCAADWAECTEADFDANDKTAEAGTIAITMNASAPYSPTCLRVKAGQTVSVQAMDDHPFESVCAEDAVMDGTTGSTTDVEVTLTTPGYYNYRCQAHPVSMVGNIQVVP